MTSFLFWNVMGNDLRSTIAQAVVERDVDILVLAELGVADGEIVAALFQATGHSFVAISQNVDKVRVFARAGIGLWQRRATAWGRARLAIWSVEVGKAPGILLATSHFISKLHSTAEAQSLLASELAKEIIRVEDDLGHQRSLLIGDLNMNPFDNGVIGALALHAVMTRQVAARRERVVQGTPYRFFYNPMWGFLGDRTAGPPGTYYHRAAALHELFWHTFDQVLLRPDLMNLLQDLEILERIGSEDLITLPGGLPRHAEFSDHLPLAFRLQLD